jgi:uncharacterized protein (DUF2252 family)
MTLPAKRQEALTQLRHLKMARSPHAYVRGSTVKFYAWLDASAAKLPTGPEVWICGDCHIGNLGAVADKKGRVATQIRDLDQTVIGNPVHDLVRLGLSLACAARGSELPGVVTAKILEHLVAGYQDALKGDFDVVKDTSYRSKSIQSLLRQSVRRGWIHLAKDRLTHTDTTIPLGKRFWPLTRSERTALNALFKTDEMLRLVTSLQSRDDDETIKLVDAAYWVKGCSSLGRLRYAVLVRVGHGNKAPFCLFDVKEGVTAAAPRSPKAKMPKDNGVRVMTGARALSPNLGNRMMAERFLDKAVVIRELMPQDLKIEVDRLTQTEAMRIARYLAGVVGRAHGRQMDKDVRAEWVRVLDKNHTSSIDAPNWLWSSVVDLVAVHEVDYLEHCRRYALAATR